VRVHRRALCRLSLRPRGLSLGHVVTQLGDEHALRVERVFVGDEIRREVIRRLRAENDGAPDLFEREPDRVGLRRRRARASRAAWSSAICSCSRSTIAATAAGVVAERAEQRRVLADRAMAAADERLELRKVDRFRFGLRRGVGALSFFAASRSALRASIVANRIAGVGRVEVQRVELRPHLVERDHVVEIRRLEPPTSICRSVARFVASRLSAVARRNRRGPARRARSSSRPYRRRTAA
jgi:hypothetical protein